jgi:hypothetical protein
MRRVYKLRVTGCEWLARRPGSAPGPRMGRQERTGSHLSLCAPRPQDAQPNHVRAAPLHSLLHDVPLDPAAHKEVTAQSPMTSGTTLRSSRKLTQHS